MTSSHPPQIVDGVIDVPGSSGEDGKFQLEQLCQLIQNPDRRLRQNALQQLLDRCEPPPSHNNGEETTVVPGSVLSPQRAAEIFNVAYLPLFRCYADRFEQCRTLAINVIGALVAQLPRQNSFYAENIVPVLCRRIGQPEIIEDSEEVRLLLVQQLHAIIIQQQLATTDGTTDPLLQCYNPIMDILVKTLSDPYPTIQRTSCTIVDALAAVSAFSFPARADQLVGPLIVMLAQRQYALRLAAVRALGTVALHIRSNSETIVRCIVAVSPLLMDGQAPVRLECGRIGCRWLLELRDRYSFFERLIPLALCGLNDESAETRAEIAALWRGCGEQYFRENEQELGRVAIVDRPPVRYPAGVQRPTLGCRAIVQRSLRVCAIVCKEMGDWKDNVRLHSLRLLWQVVLHSERALTAKFVEIAPVLLRHCVDAERDVAAEALRVAQLLGMLLKYDDWIGHALAALRSAPHLGQLKCFAAMFEAAEVAERRRHVREVAEILCNPTVCHSQKAEYQRTLIGLAGLLLEMHCRNGERSLDESVGELSLVEVVPLAQKSVEELLYIVLVKVLAMTDGDDGKELHNSAAKLFSTLCSASCGGDGAGGDDIAAAGRMHTRYLTGVLRTLNDDLDTENSEHADAIVLLHGLIKLAGFRAQTLAAISGAIELCQKHATCAARIKILAAVSTAMCGWRTTMLHDGRVSEAASVAALRKFIAEIVEPVLVWQAGRNAEALRTMATAVLRSIGQGAGAEALEIFPLLATHWVALIDDNNVVTRAYVLGCLRHCGPLPLEPLKATALAVLGRLDDPSAEVRSLAIAVLPLLRLQDGGEEYERDVWEGVVKHLMSTLLLHLDTPEIQLQARVTGE